MVILSTPNPFDNFGKEQGKSSENPFTKKKFSDELKEKSYNEFISDSRSNRTQKNISKASSYAVTIVSITVILTVIVFGLILLKSELSTREPVETVQSEETMSGDYIDLERPFAYFEEEFPESNKATEAITKKDKIKSSKSELIVSKEIKLTASVEPCEVIESNDFCLAATGKYNDKVLEFFFLKNVIKGKMFENTSSFEETEVKGSPLSAEIRIGEGDMSMLVIVNKDGSGFMVRHPKEIKVKELTESLEVKDSE